MVEWEVRRGKTPHRIAGGSTRSLMRTRALWAAGGVLHPHLSSLLPDPVILAFSDSITFPFTFLSFRESKEDL